MEWGDAATWVASIAAVAAIVIAVRTDRRSQRAAADSAGDAKRAADAAERAAAAAARQVELAEAQATKYVPPWSLTWAKGDTYLLANEGDDPVYGVRLDAPGMQLVKRFDVPAEVDAHSGITFLAATQGTRDRMVVVTWHRLADCSDESLTWRHPLPFRH